MGTNCGSLQVRLGRGGREAVLAAIERHYLAAGAKLGPARHRRELEPLSLTSPRHRKRTPAAGELGLAVSPAEKGWVTVIDSERYHADASLARALAKKLKTTVFWELTGDVSQTYLLTRFGPSLPASERSLEYANEYYDQLQPEDSRGWSFVSFCGVRAESYDRNPDELPTVPVKCSACGARRQWWAGQENNACSEAAALEPKAKKLMLQAGCCPRSPWIELTIDRGIAVRARVKKQAPALAVEVALWLDSAGERKPYGRRDLVALDLAQALRSAAEADEYEGVGLLRGKLERRGHFGLIDEGELVKWWSHGDFKKLVASVKRRAGKNVIDALAKELTSAAGAPIARADSAGEGVFGLEPTHSDRK